MRAEYLSLVLLSLFLRSTLLMLVVGIVALSVCRKSASVRHGVLVVGISCLFVLPVLPFAGPRWTIPGRASQPAVLRTTLQYAPVAAVEDASTAQPVISLAHGASLLEASNGKGTVYELGRKEANAEIAESARDDGPSPPIRQKRAIDWLYWIFAVWAVVFFGLMLRLLLSHRVAWLVTTDRGCHTAKGNDAFDSMALGKVVLSGRVGMPMTWGIAPPVVVLPSEAKDWTPDRLRAVLLHEEAHIRRRDWATQLASEIARAAYWPNPLVWLLVRQLRLEAEMACDDAVLKAGLLPSVYAGELVECVRQSRRDYGNLASVAMADQHSMSARVHAVLDPRRSRGPVRRRTAMVAALIGIAFTVVVGASWSGSAASTTNPGMNAATIASIGGNQETTTCTLLYRNGKAATDATLFVDTTDPVTHEQSNRSYRPNPDGVVTFSMNRDPAIQLQKTIYAMSPTGCALWFQPGNSSEFTCILQPFTTLRVHVRDLEGKPLRGVTICPTGFIIASPYMVAPWDPEVPGPWTQTTDDNGTATIPRLPQGYNVGFAVLDDHYCTVDSGSRRQLATASVSPDVTITAGPASTITGSVLFKPTGKPAPGMLVTAGGGFFDGTTDEHGAFTISRLQAGHYTVDVNCDRGDYMNWVAQAQLVDVGAGARSSKTVIYLTHGALITGRVTDTATGKPEPNISVSVFPVHQVGNMWIDNSTAITGSDGYYRVRTVPGSVWVEAFSLDSGGTANGVSSVRVAEDATKTVNFSIPTPIPLTPVHGVVVGPDGKPVPGALISICQPNQPGTPADTVVADSDGAFAIDEPGLEPNATLCAQSGDLAVAQPFTYSGGNRIVLRLAANVLGTLTGRITDETGKPVPGAEALFNARRVWTFAPCDADGHFEFAKAYGNAPYTLRAVAPGYRSAHARGINVSVASGQTVLVPTMVIAKIDSFVGGKVVDTSGHPVANVSVMDADNWNVEATTDQTGHFMLRGVPRGNTDVRAVFDENGGHARALLTSGRTDNVLHLYQPAWWKPSDMIRNH